MPNSQEQPLQSLPLGQVWPSLAEFQELAPTRRIIPVMMRIMADADTPISLYEKVSRDIEHGAFLLESAINGNWARYSFIGAGALATITDVAGQARWEGPQFAGVPSEGDTLQVVSTLLQELKAEPFAGLPPFTGGLVGYFGYDSVRHWEKLPVQSPDELGIPDIVMQLSSDVAIFDHHDGSVILVANAINVNGTADGVDAAYEDAISRLTALLAKVRRPSQVQPQVYDEKAPVESRFRTQKEEYLLSVKEAVQDIYDGEAFQIVVAQRFELDTQAAALDVYRMLRRLNPSPYMYLLKLRDANGTPFDIVGASPEALVTVQDRTVLTHPIAGSRPRGATPEQDVALAEELLADAKERSEHVMLVDLSRNDLQKVCEAGTVNVQRMMYIERFSHIMHISSNVQGRLTKDATAMDVLAATFPAGTLSGAPKPRAMAIIDRLEPARRGLYGGTVGYFDFNGNMDMAIAIRTAVVKDGTAYVQAGAGIVADSNPESEYQECVNKSMAALRAVAMANSLRSLDEAL